MKKFFKVLVDILVRRSSLADCKPLDGRIGKVHYFDKRKNKETRPIPNERDDAFGPFI